MMDVEFYSQLPMYVCKKYLPDIPDKNQVGKNLYHISCGDATILVHVKEKYWTIPEGCDKQVKTMMYAFSMVRRGISAATRDTASRSETTESAFSMVQMRFSAATRDATCMPEKTESAFSIVQMGFHLQEGSRKASTRRLTIKWMT